ncbi:hypothetical protein CPB84DRAFT_1846740 [Gymnopilus junonius]|uniref:Uncharacterized protein n=1 Tax=Gymnopilus junonius TaxID=109634 RepID=A0A9P5NPB7_GYMJU|nr:hypothetical protein CPB84DRAFT_1846740 [Gymnopilus junonius]
MVSPGARGSTSSKRWFGAPITASPSGSLEDGAAALLLPSPLAAPSSFPSQFYSTPPLPPSLPLLPPLPQPPSVLLLLPIPPLHAPLPPITSAPSILTSDEALPSGAQVSAPALRGLQGLRNPPSQNWFLGIELHRFGELAIYQFNDQLKEGKHNACIPFPQIKQYTLTSAGNHQWSTASQKWRFTEYASCKAQHWRTHIPTFHIKGVNLSDLAQCAKNAKGDIWAADAKIHQMCTLVPNAFLGWFLDEEGETLVCVFANRFNPLTQEGPQIESQAPYYSGSAGRTTEDAEEGRNHFFDGIPTNTLQHYHEAAQVLHSVLPPCVNTKNICHPDAKKVMAYTYQDEETSEAEYVREGGHSTGYMMHSKDMAGRNTHQGQLGIRSYFEATADLALYLRECFRVAFLDYFTKYEAAFRARCWEKADPGPWLGRAIVWKLPVHTHQDGLDDGPTAVFNCGNYTGGEFYRPGDLVIFLSGQLYHHVSEWKPTPAKSSFEKLTNRPTKWNTHTCGRMPGL